VPAVHFRLPLRVLAVAVLGCASSVALADDSSMNPFTGDSYAYFNGLDYRGGGFNTARAAQPKQAGRRDVAAPMPAQPAGMVADPAPDVVPGVAPGRLDGRVLLAAPRSFGSLQSPFRDDTGA
jgi:hypothetical protein